MLVQILGSKHQVLLLVDHCLHFMEDLVVIRRAMKSRFKHDRISIIYNAAKTGMEVLTCDKDTAVSGIP